MSEEFKCWICKEPVSDPRWFVKFFFGKTIPFCPECRQQTAQLLSNVDQMRSWLRTKNTHIGVPKWRGFE